MKQSDECRCVKTLVSRTACEWLVDGSPSYEIPAGTIGTVMIGGGSGAEVEFSVIPHDPVCDIDRDFPTAIYKDHELEFVDD